MSQAPNQIDQVVIDLARDFARRLAECVAEDIGDPKKQGTEAQKRWAEDVSRRGGTIIEMEPKTGVTGLRGGLTRYDFLIEIKKRECWIELQASDYLGSRKAVQIQSQLIGLGEGAASPGKGASFYKILGRPRQILKWSAGEASRATNPHVFYY